MLLESGGKYISRWSLIFRTAYCIGEEQTRFGGSLAETFVGSVSSTYRGDQSYSDIDASKRVRKSGTLPLSGAVRDFGNSMRDFVTQPRAR